MAYPAKAKVRWRCRFVNILDTMAPDYRRPLLQPDLLGATGKTRKIRARRAIEWLETESGFLPKGQGSVQPLQFRASSW
jgi:hypothetical protein